MFTIIWVALALIVTHLVFSLFKWGFDTSDDGMKRYAVIFAVIVLVFAAFDGFGTTALLHAFYSWLGYMLGLVVIRATGIGRPVDR